MANKPRKKTEQAEQETFEAKATEAPKKDLISFETYIQQADVNQGLVASFKYEAKKTEKGLQDRTEDEWKKDFEAQSKRVYK